MIADIIEKETNGIVKLMKLESKNRENEITHVEIYKQYNCRKEILCIPKRLQPKSNINLGRNKEYRSRKEKEKKRKEKRKELFNLHLAQVFQLLM